MPEVIKVRAASLSQAGAAVAQTDTRAATLHPGAAPVAAAGSPADGALASFAAGVASQAAGMMAQTAGRGPAMQATTQAGISRLLGADEHNADTIRALGPPGVRGGGLESR